MSASAEEMSAQVQEVVASTQELDNMTRTPQEAVGAFRVDSNGTGQQKVEVAHSSDDDDSKWSGSQDVAR